MSYSLYYISGARFPFGANHGCALLNPTQCFSEIPGAANKGNLELGLINMVHIIGRGEDFAFIDVIDFNGFPRSGLQPYDRYGLWP